MKNTLLVSADFAPPSASLWQRWIVAPVVEQLRQGITSDKIALTLALGFALSLFPILGATTVLCGLAGAWFRLNQPLIQLVNYLGYPVQLLLLIPFYRGGEILLGRPPVPLSIPLLFERFQADAGQFLRDFGMIGLGGILVWMMVAPFLIGALWLGLRPLLRNLASGRRIAAAPGRKGSE